ncbi:hypothetical protein [Paracoccus sp. Ld10]|uniref:hypothetical protein n=1 Tax=Paracoccus sp. Ld10 TaxID=649158 RepID=UPI00386BEF81
MIRVTFGLFLLAWAANKMLNAEGTISIFARFYGVESLGETSAFVIGGLQVALSLCIIAGLFKTVTYGAGVLIHGASTLSTASHIAMPLAEGSNLLFMAGLPVFAAAIALFLLRRDDTLMSVDALTGPQAVRSA